MKYHYKFFKLKVKNSEFRNSHSVVVCEDKVVLFGGGGDNAGIVNEIEINISMRSSSQLISKVVSSSKNLSRLCHSAIEYNKYMYVFGGKNPQTNEFYNDIICYSPSLKLIWVFCIFFFEVRVYGKV
jgi:N-acetylneuraminic acid mutarotase